MRLIDADVLAVKQASIAKTFARSDAQKSLMGRVMYNTDCAPTIDAVPVVRCRDCKYFMEHNDGYGGNCNHLDYDGEYEFSVAVDWFCADGERREAKA
ncbi:MAG: hypothetical protein II010_07210 [Oscillospiraceae bacterium]|nr:hypothetical protein [Oscillospiraceae bacterium]